MYKKEFIALTSTQIKLLNNQGLATTFKCSHTYVNRILKSKEPPTAPKAIAILKSAYELVAILEAAAKAEQDRLNAFEVIDEQKL